MTRYRDQITLPSRRISPDSPTYLVAEIGTNHAGERSLAKDQIRAASKAGADAVKFQLFRTEEFLGDDSLTYSYEDHAGEVHEVSQYEMFNELELPEDWIPDLVETATHEGVDFFASVADEDSLQTVLEHDVPLLKLASEDLINVKLLEAVRGADVPVIVSRGMATEDEIANALSILTPSETPELVLLHCVSCYPTPPPELNVRQISSLRDRFGCLVGLSDHTRGTMAASVSVALGACVIEKHFTMDQSLPGPDQAMSTTPTTFSEFAQTVREAEMLLGEPSIQIADCEKEKQIQFRRGIVADRTIEEGHVIDEGDIAFRRPCEYFKPYQKHEIIGRKTVTMIPENEAIREDHLQ
jgi:sialic acid synthase SpsE